MTQIERIGVVGGGAWGTALATVACRAGRTTVLWALETEVVEAINGRHENTAFLAGIALDPAIRATGALAEVADADAVFLVAPAQHLGAIVAQLDAHLGAQVPMVLCSKGIEQRTGRLMTEVVAEVLPGARLAVLSGPSFAAEVAAGLPAAVTIASAEAALAEAVAEAIGTPNFRPYTSDDPVGAEIGGAVKNVLAIACGIVVGRKLGDSARATLIARGLAEMVRLALAKGAQARTLMGLSGLGDLTLTCNGPQSRNMSLGIALGQGRPLAEVLAERRTVTEGVGSAGAVLDLARRLGVEMPIVAAVDAVVNHGTDIDAAIAGLLARPLKAE